ncbi:hypothetical protein [Hypericibacter sp.]|uniref:hypothetical protein n=1 Tax=Hypericibacter sp. TaxID=2705401 RepID=UPI003D6D23B0
MNAKRLEQILAAYGAKSERWPEAERPDALALLAHDAPAQQLLRDARRLDGLLDSLQALEPTFDAASLAARLSERPQEMTNVRSLAASRARWRIPFIMPNLIGLAAAAVAGFWIGWTNPGTENTQVAELVPYVADMGDEESLPW